MKATIENEIVSDRVTKASTNLLSSSVDIMDIDTSNNLAWFYRDKNCAAINSDPEDIWDERLSEQSKTDRN